MKKALLVLILLLLPFVQSQSIRPMNSSVALMPNLVLSIESSSVAYCPNDTLNITSYVLNFGNLPALFDINSTIYDQYSNLYANSTWPSQSINPAEIKSFSVLKNVTGDEIPGMYYAFSTLKYGSTILQNQTSFRIKQGFE